jgi:DNA repair protein RadA/Sms
MAKTSDGSFHACGGCGYSSPKWFGRCPDCGSWEVSAHAASGEALSEAVSLGPALEAPRQIQTSLDEVDRVLDGGLVGGGVVLLAGEPGIGKSTLVLQMLAGIAGTGGKALLATGEESLAQVSGRGRRLGLQDKGVAAVAATSVSAVIASADKEKPDVLVVDSVQTLHDPELDQAPGSVTQVRECAARLVMHAKAAGTSVVLVGHVTKDGSVAGPKTLEHVVDTVLLLEGERSGALRFLRVMKNRFGSCEETGVFVMGRTGLEAVADPSSMLLADRRVGTTGSVIFPAIEGSRPVLAEVQALVSRTNAPQPRRVATGVDPKRLSLLLAVLSERGKLSLSSADVFVASAGGVLVREPAADLAVAGAIFSTCNELPLDPGLVVLGELGLGGEVRRVPGSERRLAEAKRLGFRFAITPRGVERPPEGLQVIEVSDVLEFFDRLRSLTLGAAVPAPRETASVVLK